MPHLDDAFALARWLTGNRADAEDVVQDACLRAYRAIATFAGGNPRARELVSYFVGQGVGMVDSVKSAGAVVQEFKTEFLEAVEHMQELVAE